MSSAGVTVLINPCPVEAHRVEDHFVDGVGPPESSGELCRSRALIPGQGELGHLSIISGWESAGKSPGPSHQKP